jgi:RNA polymerase sigma-70 factor (ECF subfamily)
MNMTAAVQSMTGSDIAEPNFSLDFETLYKKYRHAVRMVVSRFPFHDAAADDLVQDTFVQAWQNRDSLKDPNAFSGWIVSIARNRCLNELRKQRPQVSIAMTDMQGDSEGHEMEVVLVAEDDSLSLQFEHSLILLRRLIEMHVDSPRAAAARLFYIEQKPVKIIADELNMNLNTVLSHLRRFRLIVSQAMLRLVEENDLGTRHSADTLDAQYIARLLQDSERNPRKSTSN